MKLNSKITQIKETNENENTEKNINFLLNKKNQYSGIDFLKLIPDKLITTCFFDPQYRVNLDRMKYGNEGKTKETKRLTLEQMDTATISLFIKEIERCLKGSGYLFMWVDKFILCQGIENLFDFYGLKLVDLIVWDKQKMGMGYRTRNQCEFLIIFQKLPILAKKTWKIKNIRNIWNEKIINREHPHQKPINLQKILIETTSNENDYILDPCAGSYNVLTSCIITNRNFIGCDINEN